MNRFCLNNKLSNRIVRAIQVRRMSIPPLTEIQPVKDYELFLRISQILRDSRICNVSPAWPLAPEGSMEEMLVGKTEPVKPEHRVFYFNFYATVLTTNEKDRMKKMLESFPQYFEWVE